MIPDELRRDAKPLMYGAAGVAAMITLVALAFELLGGDVFIGVTVGERLFELLAGWAILWAVIWPSATVLQVLSYYTKLPPVVEWRDES